MPTLLGMQRAQERFLYNLFSDNMYHFSNHTAGCETAEGVVFLDFRTGQYLAIAASDVGAFRQGITGWPSPANIPLAPLEPLSNESMATLNELSKRGILSRSPPEHPHVRLRDVPTPTETLPYNRHDNASSMFRLWLNVTLVLCLFYIWINLKLGRLELIIRNIQSLKRCAHFQRSPSELARLQTIVCHFRRTTLWFYSRQNKCLFDSLVLTRFLYCHDISPTLIFGVRTKPFSAHAWVQISNLMLVDSPELALQMTPIFAT